MESDSFLSVGMETPQPQAFIKTARKPPVLDVCQCFHALTFKNMIVLLMHLIHHKWTLQLV